MLRGKSSNTVFTDENYFLLISFIWNSLAYIDFYIIFLKAQFVFFFSFKTLILHSLFYPFWQLDSHSIRYEVIHISSWFWFVFLRWLVMLSTFSCNLTVGHLYAFGEMSIQVLCPFGKNWITFLLLRGNVVKREKIKNPGVHKEQTGTQVLVSRVVKSWVSPSTH